MADEKEAVEAQGCSTDDVMVAFDQMPHTRHGVREVVLSADAFDALRKMQHARKDGAAIVFRKVRFVKGTKRGK